MQIRLDKQILKIIIISIAVVVLFAIAYFVIDKLDSAAPNENVGESVSDGYIYLDGVAYKPRRNLNTMLVLGIDNFGKMESSGTYYNNGQSDFMGLLVYDRTEKTYSILHINRDTMAYVDMLGIGGKVADTQLMQIALAHTYGSGMHDSCRNSVNATENLLYGIEIDHYLAVNMTAIEKLVDAIGGVTVTINDDFSQVDSTLIQGETMLLNGRQALTYVRSRSMVGDGTNLARTARQKDFIQQLLKQFNANDELAATALVEVSDYILSDLSANALISTANLYMEAECADILSPEGEVKMGEEFIEYYADDDALRELVIKLFYKPVEE